MTMASNLTLKCHNSLNSLAKERTVELSWILEHNGFRGNKVADDLTRLGKPYTQLWNTFTVGGRK